MFQQQSDVEWKFGLAKLIRSMHRTDMSPSPINLVTTWLVYLFRVCKKGRSLSEIMCNALYFLLGKKSKVDDYSRLQESSSAKSAGMFKKSIITQEMDRYLKKFFQLKTVSVLRTLQILPQARPRTSRTQLRQNMSQIGPLL